MESQLTNTNNIKPNNDHQLSNGDKIRWNDEFFSTSTLEECEKHFDQYYQNDLEPCTETKDKLSLLRSCIDLLNRLEGRNNHNLFAGKLLTFLARKIPLFDQSGLNQRSEFSVKKIPKGVIDNLHQIALKSSEKDKGIVNADQHEIEEGETLSDDESNETKPPEDPEILYERFWKVQQFLGQPNSLYDKNSMFTFRTNVDKLIHHMSDNPAKLRVWDLRTPYMTVVKSLALQFKDVNWRRCFLVQILVVLQYLNAPVEQKLENQVLDKVQASWTSDIARKIYSLLDKMPNQEEGKRFLGFVKQLLRREDLWNKWKNEKCEEPKKPEEDDFINMRGTYHKRRKLSDEMSAAKAYDMHVIGSPEMSRLWNNKPTTDKFTQPELVKFINIPQEKQTECFKDPNYSFRVLRLLRKSPFFFGQSSAVIQSLDGYLKAAATRYMTANGLSVKNSNSSDTVVKSQQCQPQSQPSELKLKTPSPKVESFSPEESSEDMKPSQESSPILVEISDDPIQESVQ